MKSVERIYAAIEHKKTDKIPKGEIGIADDLTKKLLNVSEVGFKEALEVRKMLKMDLFGHWCVGTPTNRIGTDSDGNIIAKDSWGTVYKSSGISSDVIEPAIKDEDMINSLVFPELSVYEKNLGIISSFHNETDLFVFGALDGVFAVLTNLCGFEGLMMYTCTNEEEIKMLAMRIAEHNAGLAKMVINAGANSIFISDDIAYNTGTFISPTKMREIIFPALKKQVELIKKYKDIPVFMHTDGDINAVMEDIIDCGFDGLQSLQPSANMDLENLKSKYGQRLCLMGNIDLNHILPFGTKEEVRRNVKETIDIGNKDGGYILSTCNILTGDIPAVNAVAMYDEAENYL
jgi:uroporphyrinogen decarboxylase